MKFEVLNFGMVALLLILPLQAAAQQLINEKTQFGEPALLNDTLGTNEVLGLRNKFKLINNAGFWLEKYDIYTYENDQPALSQSIFFSYNTDSTQDNKLTKVVFDTSSVNSTLETSHYDINKLLTEKVIQKWEEGEWINLHKTLFEYDNNNYLSIETEQSWDTINSNWTDNSRTHHYVNELGRDDSLYVYLNEQNDWINYYKIVYDYSGDTLRRTTTSNWDQELSDWQFTARSFHAYTDSTRTIRRESYFPSTGWMFSTRQLDRYKDRGQLLQSINQLWNSSSAIWTNNVKTDFFYDSNFNLQEVQVNFWNQNDWALYSESVYTYTTTRPSEVPLPIEPVSRIDMPRAFILKQNYPNPFNPTTNIGFDLIESGKVTLEIYNIKGEKIAVLLDQHLNVGSHIVPFDGSNFTSGMYLYKLHSNSESTTRKMMLIK